MRSNMLGYNAKSKRRDIMTFTHLDASGQARMVNLRDKPESRRRALAAGSVRMQAKTLLAIREQQHHKGDVLAVARVAGIMAAKQTAGLIPLCHPLGITACDLDFELAASDLPGAAGEVKITASCETHGPTGVEMEALTAVSVAALTIYDMCKAGDKLMLLNSIRLLEKEGGRSGHWKRAEQGAGEFDAG